MTANGTGKTFEIPPIFGVLPLAKTANDPKYTIQKTPISSDIVADALNAGSDDNN